MSDPTLSSRPPSALHLPRSTILLTIDMQRGFDQFPSRNNPACEGNLAALQTAWRAAGRPLWHVKHDSTEARSVFRPTEPGNAFKPETAPRGTEPTIHKSAHSAFIGTDLLERLRGAGCDTLVIAGIQTNYCVASTARMAGNLGFATFVVADACATFPQTLLDGRVIDAGLAHDVALAELHGEFATVVGSEAVLDALSRAATAPA